MDVLVVEKLDRYFKVLGTQPIDLPPPENKFTIRASLKTLELAEDSLEAGKTVYVKDNVCGPEATPWNLLITESDDPLEVKKNIAVNQLNILINNNIFGVSIIDSMDYLNCMMKLMSVGIFITDENREDKYFEIIEAAQTTEEPAPLTENSSFEEEQTYIEQKRKYDQAQMNLETLEKYLNAYDKLSKIKFVNDLLNKYKDIILAAKTQEDIDAAIKEYTEKLDVFFYHPDV